VRDDVVHQVRRSLRHAAGATGRAKAAPLAAERDDLVVAAVAAAAMLKAQLGFQATLAVRNRMVPAYIDIMNMNMQRLG